MKLKLTTLLILMQVWAFAQRVEDISFAMDGEKVKIFYTLVGDFPDQTFEVKIYTSVDKFAKPLEELSGDANRKNIKPGKKEVTWDAKKEYKLFEGDISFKIVATVVSNYVVSSPIRGEVFKRGKKVEINWEGFRPETPVNITVFYGNGNSREIASYYIGNSYSWKVRGKPGRGAYIKVTDAGNKNAFAKSGSFTIKRKVPMFVQVGVAAVVASGVLYIFLKPEEQTPLPLPPDPSR
jgi:hypothetical protein